MKPMYHTQMHNVYVISPFIFKDERGTFREMFNEKESINIPGPPTAYVQDNVAVSRKNVLRGLHFQKAPHSQGKLVTCLHGKIWDVFVDLRPDSLYYKQWMSIELVDDAGTLLYVPPGFAHGYLTLTSKAVVLYKCTEYYHPECESGIRWDDPDLNIPWKFSDVIISEKDEQLPFLKEIENDLGHWW